MDVTEGKPSPQGFLLAAQKLRLKPEECVVMEDAVAAKNSIHFSKVGLLHAVMLKPRLVTMGFRRDKSGVHPMRREFVLGSRVEIQFRLYRKFARAHDLRG